MNTITADDIDALRKINARLESLTTRRIEILEHQLERAAKRRDVACVLIESLTEVLLGEGLIDEADDERYKHVVKELRD